MIDERTILRTYRKRFGHEAQLLARAPGRVNLIGEHTDYNGGFVLPIAIDRDVAIAAAETRESTVRIYSVQFDETVEIPLSYEGVVPLPGTWASYVLGVMREFQLRGYTLPSLTAVIDGDVPLGAGLSSSAALEVATAALLDAMVAAGMDGRTLALLAQDAENGPCVGMQCGIMDQFISANARIGRALQLDCHSLQADYIRFAEDAPTVVILDSGRQRGLVDSEYNQRRAECTVALSALRTAGGEDFPTLRHVPADMLERHASSLDPIVARRARHAITENGRVHDFADAIQEGDWTRAGRRLLQSHASLRDDYQVSCPELDWIVEHAMQIDGVHGCRMTGAGFGGSAVALAEERAIPALSGTMADRYAAEFGRALTVYTTHPAPGAHVSVIATPTPEMV